jgi:hypothetical protein
MTKRRKNDNLVRAQLSEDGMAMLKTMKQIYAKETSTIIEKAIFTLFQDRKAEMLEITKQIGSRFEDDVFRDRAGRIGSK